MSEVKITDLVPQETIDNIKELDTELKALLYTYTSVAKDLARGVEVPIKVAGDIDKLERLLAEKTREATVATERLNEVMAQQRQVIGNTTNVISRHLMEQERVNKTTRDAYTEQEKVKQLLEHFHDTYDRQVQSLARINAQLKANSKEQKDNEKALSHGRMSIEQFTTKQANLIAQHRALTQEKRTLTQIMTAEEKATQSQEGSYVHMSQQLELLKKAYKDLSAEGRNSDFGKELEQSIQNLDTHLKDTAADMGEFQRNVGNYAIAGQNGVVATESLIAVMSQEARTQQDLVDQTKILEEAKLMLNKDDVNYQATLDSLNAKLDENRRKLTDVSDIMGKEATTVAEAEAQNKRLAEAMKHIDLTSEDAKKKLEEMRAQIARNNETIGEATGTNEKFADSMLSMIGVNVNFGSSLMNLNSSGNFLDGIMTKTKAFGATLLGLLANPWVLAFLGIAGVVAGFKWWYDYNKGLLEASRLTENFTGTTGEAADKVTADMQTLADKMGKGYDATISAANTLVQQFGLSWEKAGQKMQDGIVAGADMSGNMIANIERFAPAMRDAGVSADEFMAILSETRNGIFNEDGIQNIMKAGTRLRAMTKQTEEALDAVGISAKQMQSDLENGNISMLDAVQQVAGKLKEIPENSQEAGQIMKNVFGRTAAEGGTLLIQSIADINTNLDKAKENMGELGKVNEEQMNAQRELNEALMSIFKMSGTSFETMTTKAKTFVVQGLTGIIKGCVDIVNWFIRMYNKSIVVRAGVNNIVNSFKTLWEVAKFILAQLVDSFKSIGTVIEGIFTRDWNKIKKGWQDGMSALKGNVETMARNIAQNAADAFNNTLGGELKEVSVDLKGNVEVEVDAPDSQENSKNKPKRIGQSEESKKAAKEAEKAAKKELKRLHELEESKIAVMADGHEKEIALIRLKFKKKLDEIEGEGETQTALRLQLAEQCEREVAQCELSYQRELAKINLENRLAAVKKGSKEELDIKLAQIEARRAAEIEAAKKSGADINLINAKYDKERMNLESEYASHMADETKNRYALEQVTRNKAYSDSVNALKERYAKEIALAKGNVEKQEEIKRQFENDMFRLEVEFSQKSVDATIEMIESILKLENLSAEDRLKWEQELAKAKIELANQVADANSESVDRQIADDERLTEKRKAHLQKWLQTASEVLNTIGEFVNTLFDAQVTKIEEQQEANDEAGEAEIERITNLVEKKVITEEEGEARKRASEYQTAKKNEELENKKQQLKQKQAAWDKANNLAQAGIATALAITQALPNIAMAAIAAAMGAVQIATILATPIPKYAHGTDYHKGGPAIVGDGGRQELVLFHGGAWLTPDTPTLVDMPRGAVVVPRVNEYDGIVTGLIDASANDNTQTPVIVANDYHKLEEKMDRVIYLFTTSIKRRRGSNLSDYMNLFKATKVL